MKEFLKTALLLLFCCCGSTLISAPSPWDAWRSGYTSCEQAERQFERGNYTEALSLFEKAKKNYLDVRSARPDWNQRVISERIGECERRINEVRRLLGAVKRKPAATAAVTKKTTTPSAAVAKKEFKPGDQVDIPIYNTAETAGEVITDTFDTAAVLELRSALKRSNDELERSKKSLIAMRAKLLETKAEVDSLKKNQDAQRNFEQEITNLVRDRRIAMEKYTLLEARCKKLEADMAKPSAQLELLQSRLLEERLLLEQERKRAVTAENALQDAENRARQNQLARNAAEKVLSRERIASDKLLNDMKTLQLKIQSHNDKIAELNAELERSRKHNSELTDALKSRTSNADAALAGVQAAVSGQQAAEKEKNAAVAARKNAEAEKIAAETEKDAAVAARKNAVAEMNLAIAEKKIAVAEKNAAVAEKNAAIAEKNAALSEKGRAVSELNAAMVAVAGLRKEISEKESKISSIEKENSARNDRIAALQEELRRNQAHLDSMKSEFDRGRSAIEQLIKDKENLQKRNQTLENDMKTLSVRNTALAKRLESRDSEDFRNASIARETCRKLEKDLLTLQNELVVIRNSSNTAASRNADFERKLKSAETEIKEIKQRENLLIAEKDQQNAEIKRLKDIEHEFDSLKRNFEALTAENRENRALLAAAKPREKELARVKLRLLELDRLKAALTREQQLNEELRSESRRLAGEAKTLRQRSSELDAARRRIAELEGTSKELEQLKNVQKEYLRLAAIEPELAKLKIRSGELEMQLKERHIQIRQLQDSLQDSGKKRSALEKEIAALQGKLRDIKELETMVATQNSEMERLNSMLKRFQSGDESVIPAEYRRQIDDLRRTAAALGPLNDRHARLQKEFDQMKEQFTARINQLNLRCESAEEFGRRRNEEINVLRKLNAELAEMNRNSSAALKNKVDQAQLDRLTAEISAMNKLYTEVTAERDRLNSEIDALRRGVAAEVPAVKIAESPEELSGAGLVAERNGNTELAIWNYRQALLADENFRPAHLRLGHILYDRKDFAGALPHLSAARTGGKFSLDLAVKTARCQIALKRYGNAKSIVDQLLKSHSGNDKVQLLAGLIESGSGSASAAEERLITAVRLAPQDPENLIELARFLADSITDRKGEAVKYYELARARGGAPVPELEKKLASLLDSRREMIRFLSGAASEAEISGDFGSAVWYYRKLVEMKPEDYTPRLALALHRSGRTASARETLEFNKPTRLGMVVLTIIENDSGNDSAALRAARQSAGAELPENWQALTMDVAKLKASTHPSAAVRVLLSGIQK